MNLKLGWFDEGIFEVERAMNLRAAENSPLTIDKAAHRAGDTALLENKMGDCPNSLIAHCCELPIILPSQELFLPSLPVQRIDQSIRRRIWRDVNFSACCLLESNKRKLQLADCYLAEQHL